MRFRYRAGSSPERASRHATETKRGAILVISYLNLNGRHTEEDVSMPDGIMVASACLSANLSCGAIAGPETSNNSLSIAPRTVAASRLYWWFPSGVVGLASARHRSVDSRRPRNGQLLMDIVGYLSLRWCIIIDDLAKTNALARYLAPYRTRG